MHIYTLKESTRITRVSGTWSCHRHYFQTIGINSYMSDENRNELFKLLLRQISSYKQTTNRMKVFIRNIDTDLVVLAVAAVNELDFWECAHSCPLYCCLSWTRIIKSTSNDARLELDVIQLLVSMV